MACQAYSSNAGLVRSATAIGQTVAADPNDLSIAPMPGFGPPQGGGNTTQTPPPLNPNAISVPGEPYTLRAALYTGGTTPCAGHVVTLWSMPLSCMDYLANRLPPGASFLQLTLPALSAGAAAQLSFVADGDTPGPEQAFAYLNTAAPNSTALAQGSVSITQLVPGQRLEGSLEGVLEDGTRAVFAFGGSAAAIFCAP